MLQARDGLGFRAEALARSVLAEALSSLRTGPVSGSGERMDGSM
jgi:hypothetical protein